MFHYYYSSLLSHYFYISELLATHVADKTVAHMTALQDAMWEGQNLIVPADSITRTGWHTHSVHRPQKTI